MTQTRVGSLIEAWANIFVGFAINFIGNLTILPWLGYDVTPVDAFNIGLLFTGISLARSYWLRRVFNRIRSLHA